MFRRYPYWGWLAISLLLWCINGYNFHLHRQAMLPERMAHSINKDLHHREDVYEGFILEKDIIRRMFADSLTENETKRINSFPFFIYCYENDTLRYWNTNTIIAAPNDSALGNATLLRNEKGVFIQKCVQPYFLDGRKRLVILFPLLITYPLENDYLKSHFAASEYIPLKTKIIPEVLASAADFPVTLRGNIKIFYLHFNSADIRKWIPDTLFIIMLIAALLASISWIQLMIIYLTRNKYAVAGLSIIVIIIAAFRFLIYKYGLPFNLDVLTFFSPGLYASSKYLSSFGDLCINTLCVLWIVIFITRHTPYYAYLNKVQSASVRYGLAVLLSLGLVAYVYFFVSIIKSLVLDSNISFDVSHFYAINVYTILGLLLIGIITGISCLIIYLFNIQFRQLINNKWTKVLVVALFGCLYILVAGKTGDVFSWFLLGWLILFLVVLDVRNLTLVSDLFEPHMIFWAVFICIFCTAVVYYFNQIREKETRIGFVERLTPRQDKIIEYAFDKTANNIERDKILKAFFYKPSLGGRRAMDQRFETQYLEGPINKYQVKVYLFDTKKNALFNKDTADYYSLLVKKNESSPTVSPYLFYKESILDRHYYLSYIPVYSDTLNVRIGYVMIDLDLKKQAAEKTVYPELLQPSGSRVNAEVSEYAYAVYINNKLITQTNDYPFTIKLPNDSLRENQYRFYNINGVSELHFRTPDRRVIVAVHYHNQWLETVTLFSYLFGTQVLIALVILLYQVYLSYFSGAFSSGRFIRLTLRKRVHFSMLAVVLVSFLIIATVTGFFFTNQYRNTNSKKLQDAMQVAKQSVQDYLKKENAFDANYMFDSVSRSARFKLYIANIAATEKIDINIFDDRGNLYATSQEDIYDKGLISRVMRPDAFYELNILGKSIVKQDEQVADLSYLSGYQPLRDEQGFTLGYMNVPLFSSERDLNFQLSNIVVTLINLYAFIFLISSLITVLITRWITSTFNLIIKQFGQINLKRNERIQWPYNDEIGLLVSEYNKMVNKVEENAALLAQSERENAWREMARQVAHEIKNPLTPMKLNIQYLQQAMKNDHPDIRLLTDRVSASIIEQIDNLSYIASGFSDFAKMPEARAEEIDLLELLNIAIELYHNDSLVDVSLRGPDRKIFVCSDRSQLLRVFTNLLSNAKQAIPNGRHGSIEVIVKEHEGDIITAFRDNGTGISEEAAQKMFQPYFTTKSSGTGLGLAMTRKIIEFWKGKIWFETEDRKGTTFYIQLPAVTRGE